MKIIAYELGGPRAKIRPAPVKRDWMDATPYGYAYRCLPLNIANMHGWEVLNEAAFTLGWNGGVEKEAVKIEAGDPKAQSRLPISHFGSGIVTFHISLLLRTDPGYNLFVMGSPNFVKDGAQALCGVVETDWAPYSFTMNWKITRPHTPVHFAAGEPICFFFPVPRGLVESAQPEFQPIAANPDLKAQYELWNKSRAAFIQDLNDPASQAAKDKWQKLYYRGLDPDGKEQFGEHQIKLNVKEFK